LDYSDDSLLTSDIIYFTLFMNILFDFFDGTMGEKTIEEYMAQIRYEAGARILRPAFGDTFRFELKGKFIKKLRENIFSGTETEDANEHINKVLEIIDLFHEPDVNEDQIMLRAFLTKLTGHAYRWLKNVPSGIITTWNSLKKQISSQVLPTFKDG
ncbi:hypothetical protein Tco_1062118, partial [Tanacetum coccineum]